MAEKFSRRSALKKIGRAAGAIGGKLLIPGVLTVVGGFVVASDRQEKEKCKRLDQDRKETGGFDIEALGNIRSITLRESGRRRCAKNPFDVDQDISQKTFESALRQIQGRGCKIEDVTPIEERVGWGSETRGLIVRTDCD